MYLENSTIQQLLEGFTGIRHRAATGSGEERFLLRFLSARVGRLPGGDGPPERAGAGAGEGPGREAARRAEEGTRWLDFSKSKVSSASVMLRGCRGSVGGGARGNDQGRPFDKKHRRRVQTQGSSTPCTTSHDAGYLLSTPLWSSLLISRHASASPPTLHAVFDHTVYDDEGWSHAGHRRVLGAAG